uniref:Capsid protein n=1 Tax=Cruciviridae sp. TaxID=1955495 RepID=A0A1S6LVM8_9VIRU|nr:capsid protein [Cruciviridae sp.]AQU11780.1 capsid protein [Cruciviridae sp.]
MPAGKKSTKSSRKTYRSGSKGARRAAPVRRYTPRISSSYIASKKSRAGVRAIGKSGYGGKYATKYGGIAGGALGTGIGAMFGNPLLGGALGAGIGNVAGSLFHSITGLGEYKVAKNTLMMDPPPVVNPVGNGGTVVKHREYLGDIISSPTANTFQLQSFALNPAQDGTFPWLSQIAANYEQWCPEGIIFEFRSMSADALNSVNTALGTVIMATSYNATSPVFASKSEMENYEYGSSCKPSQSMFHPIECARQETVLSDLYTRSAPLALGQDLRFYDLGLFQIATAGFQGTSVNCGELWITYEVSLLKPKLYSSLGNDSASYSAYWQTGGVIGGSAPTSAAPLQSIGGNAATSYNGIVFTNILASPVQQNSGRQFYFTATTFFFPGWFDQPGSFLIQLVWNGSSTSVVGFTCTGTNCIVNTSWATVANVGTTTQLVQNIMVITSANSLVPQIVLSGGTIPATCTQATMIVTQIANNMFTAIQNATAVSAP